MKYEVAIECKYCENSVNELMDKEEYQDYLEMYEDGKRYCCSNCTSRNHKRFREEFRIEREKEAKNA